MGSVVCSEVTTRSRSPSLFICSSTAMNQQTNTPRARIEQGSTCPSCGAAMAVHRFKRQLGGEVLLDICFACQGIWFDEHESAQLAPAGVLDLFRLLHEHKVDQRQPWSTVLRCPRCRESLLNCLDSTRAGRFAYGRCPQRHGRYSAFAAFMIEKGFVRQLNGAEVTDLARRVRTIRCASCGAPVDITRDHVCNHCRSPIVILDPDAVRTALADFGSKARRQEAADPHAIADALIANERQKSLHSRQARKDVLETELSDLVVGGIETIWNLIRR